jgi:hypothetical protein
MTTPNKDICYSNILATMAKDKIPCRFASETQQDPDAFIQEFNGHMVGYDESQAKILFKLEMDGNALDWACTQRCDIGYPELIQNFRKRFLAADKTLTKTLLRIENEETPKHFLDRASPAAIQGGISDDRIMLARCYRNILLVLWFISFVHCSSQSSQNKEAKEWNGINMVRIYDDRVYRLHQAVRDYNNDPNPATEQEVTRQLSSWGSKDELSKRCPWSDSNKKR